MNAFSLSVFSLSFVLGLLSFLLEGNQLEGLTKRVFSVIFLSSLLPFLIEGVTLFSEMPDFSLPSYESSLETVSKEALEAGLGEALMEEFGMEKDEVRVMLVGFSTETMTAKSVTVFLSGAAVFLDQNGIRAYVNSQKCGNCEVVYE